MGICSSASDDSGTGAAVQEMSAFEKKLAAHVKEVCDAEKARVSAASEGKETASGDDAVAKDVGQHLTKILLRLPTVKAAFERLRALFNAVDVNDDHSISIEELMTSPAFGDANPEELKTYFAEADIDHSNGIEFKEFILVMAFAYFGNAGVLPKLDAGVAEQTREAFLTAAQAFHFFDTDHDGSIVKSEVISSMQRSPSSTSIRGGHGGGGKKAAGGVGGGIGVAFMQSRFAEMDADQNGCITFKEFLFAFVDWAGIDDEEDEIFGAEEGEAVAPAAAPAVAAASEAASPAAEGAADTPAIDAEADAETSARCVSNARILAVGNADVVERHYLAP